MTLSSLPSRVNNVDNMSHVDSMSHVSHVSRMSNDKKQLFRDHLHVLQKTMAPGLMLPEEIPAEPGGRTMVMVFSGGKCGSTSLYATFLRYRIPVLRVHNTEHFIDEYAPFLKGVDSVHSLKPDDILEFLLQFYGSIIVMDVYRDPIERKVSSLFQNFSVNMGRISMTIPEWNEALFTEQRQIFETRLMPILERRHGLDTYYPHFFQAPFDFERGYQEMVHPVFSLRHRVKFIKMRFSEMRQWPKMIAKIFGWTAEHELEMVAANQSCEKKYAAVYEFWRDHFKLSSVAVLWDHILDPVFTKYHTVEETAAYFDKWSQRIE